MKTRLRLHSVFYTSPLAALTAVILDRCPAFDQWLLFLNIYLDSAQSWDPKLSLLLGNIQRYSVQWWATSTCHPECGKVHLPPEDPGTSKQGMSLLLAPRTKSSTSGWRLLFSDSATAADTRSWMRKGSCPVDEPSVSSRRSVTRLSNSFCSSSDIAKITKSPIKHTISWLTCGEGNFLFFST